jgi:phosphonoacetaldehyde hydrolase
VAAGDELAVLSPNERAALHEKVGAKLKAAGADCIIETVADLPQLIDLPER